MSSDQECVHMLWIIPQYFLLVTAEIMFYITAIDFAYTQVCIYLPLLHAFCPYKKRSYKKH